MPDTLQGSVLALWRYPVKSMLGEESSAAEVTERGLAGERAGREGARPGGRGLGKAHG